ncbi:MAG: carboxymuconolactone decarboxylase family protein [Vicinamibacterales bacterium]
MSHNVPQAAAVAEDPTVGLVYREIEEQLGFGIVPNVFRAMAAHPAVLEANWFMFQRVVLGGVLPRAVKEMVGVVIGAVRGSAYVRDVHTHSLGMQGVTREVLSALAAGDLRAAAGTPATVALLELARDAAAGGADRVRGGIARLRAAGLSEVEALEGIGAIELFLAVATLTDILDVPLDQV